MIAALVPAAGSSARMGQPKLLLQFDGVSLIGRLVASLRAGGAGRVVVIAPPDNAPEGPAVATEARLAGAELVVPLARPAHMRDSIELGLRALARQDPPRNVILTPGDFPGITAKFVAQLIDYAASRPDRIIIPCHNGRRGHPIVLPWAIAAQIHALPVGVGVNALVAEHGKSVVELETPSAEIVTDLDTPDDLRHWMQRQESRRGASDGSELQVSDAGFQIPDTRFQNAVHGVPRMSPRFRVLVRLFALAKDRAGQREVEIELEHGSTVCDLRTALAESWPALAPLLTAAMIAVDEEYAGDDTPIQPGSRLAVIPPVSGGAGVIRP
jgi:molybdenum cofactor cytidylyltransferase